MPAPPSFLHLHDRENVGTIPRFPYGRHRSADRLYKDLPCSSLELITNHQSPTPVPVLAYHSLPVHPRIYAAADPIRRRPLATGTIAGRSSLSRSSPAAWHTPYHRCCCRVSAGQHQAGRCCISGSFPSVSAARWGKGTGCYTHRLSLFSALIRMILLRSGRWSSLPKLIWSPCFGLMVKSHDDTNQDNQSNP